VREENALIALHIIMVSDRTFLSVFIFCTHDFSLIKLMYNALSGSVSFFTLNIITETIITTDTTTTANSVSIVPALTITVREENALNNHHHG